MSEASAISPMRIAVVIESFDPAAGGNEKSTAQILAELAERGHDVTLIAGCCAPADRPAGVTTLTMSTQRSSSVFRLRAFSRWAEQALAAGEFDTSLSVTMAVPSRVLQPRGGTVRETIARNVARRGGGWRSIAKAMVMKLDPKQQLLLGLERRTLASPAVFRVAALSRYVVGQLETHYRFPAERTVLIPNAAVMPEADAGQRATWRRAVRERHGVPADALVLLLAAHNPGLKGYATLLGALGILRGRGVEPVALLVGGFGPSELAASRRQGLADAVRVVGRAQDMPAMYAAADLTVLPSWYDPSSKVVLESLMMSTPAISTVYNGASDHIEPAAGSPRGCVVNDPGDAGQLAVAIERLADAVFRAACSAACDGLADQLSMARHVDRLERVLVESVLSGEPV